MSTQTICNGCGARLREPEICLQIRRVDDVISSWDLPDVDGLPTDDAHLCKPCAKIAFTALKAASQAATGGGK